MQIKIYLKNDFGFIDITIMSNFSHMCARELLNSCQGHIHKCIKNAVFCFIFMRYKGPHFRGIKSTCRTV